MTLAPSSDPTLTQSRSRIAGANLLALLAFVAASFAAVYPMLGHAYLPLVDTPNHIARLAILADPDGPMSKYYEVGSFVFVPNASIDLLWMASGMTGDPVAFTRAAMMFYAVALIFSVMVLSRVAQGRWTAWPAGVALVVYNGNFIWGFQNYVFATPFALLALALWLALESRPILWRAALFVPICLLIFHMHFLAFLMLAVTCFGREMQRVLQERCGWRELGRRFVVSGFPFVTIGLAFVLVEMTTENFGAGSGTHFGTLIQRFRIVYSAVWELPAVSSLEIAVLSLASLIFLTICIVLIFQKNRARLEFADKLKGPLIALLAVTVLIPVNLGSAFYVDVRFPFVVVALLFAGTRWVEAKRSQLLLVILIVMGLALGRSYFFEKYSDTYNADIADLRAVLNTLPEDNRLFSVRSPEQERDKPHWHISAYATLYANSFIPTFFQGTHPVRLRDEWQDRAVAASRPPDARRVFIPEGFQGPNPDYYFYENWPEKFTHLLFLDEIPADFVLDERLEPLSSAGRFTLFTIKTPPG